MTWRYVLTKGVCTDWRCALLADGVEALVTLAAGDTGATNLLVHDWAHLLPTHALFSQQLLKRREQYLLRILQRDISILTFFTGVDTDSTNNELLLCVDLNELFLAGDLMAYWRHGSVVGGWSVACELSWSK